jgi:hypothetical protein
MSWMNRATVSLMRGRAPESTMRGDHHERFVRVILSDEDGVIGIGFTLIDTMTYPIRPFCLGVAQHMRRANNARVF